MLSIYVDEKGKPYKTAGKIDYVASWYFKATKTMQYTNIKTAFVSTNSITQGEQVAAIWKPLYERFGIQINFAYRSFKWNSESSSQAQVYVVIIGFSCTNDFTGKSLFAENEKKIVQTINPYLLEGNTVFVEARRNPVCNVPIMINGGKPTEGGFLILSKEEKEKLLQKEPQAESFIRPFMMGKDFIDQKPRYCLWLVNANLSTLRKCPLILKRIEAVRQFRLSSKKMATQKKAENPMLFAELTECNDFYIAIPEVSSAQRRYIPIGYLDNSIIPGNKIKILQGATLYHLGILTSNVHMAWMRTVTGRLGMGYSYSINIVYNNFPWPSPTEKQKARIEKTAQDILNARARYPGSSLADLYDPLLMPADLRRAHIENDKAVMEAYGFSWRTMKEEDCVTELMKMYQDLVNKEK